MNTILRWWDVYTCVIQPLDFWNCIGHHHPYFLFHVHVSVPCDTSFFITATTENPVSPRFEIVERNTGQPNVETVQLVLMASNSCLCVSLANSKYPQVRLEFAMAPWVPWHTVWERWHRSALSHPFFFPSVSWHVLAIPILRKQLWTRPWPQFLFFTVSLLEWA